MRSAEGEDAREVMVIQLAEGGTIVPRSQDQIVIGLLHATPSPSACF